MHGESVARRALFRRPFCLQHRYSGTDPSEDAPFYYVEPELERFPQFAHDTGYTGFLASIGIFIENWN
jgi:hypothetical protein